MRRWKVLKQEVWGWELKSREELEEFEGDVLDDPQRG